MPADNGFDDHSGQDHPVPSGQATPREDSEAEGTPEEPTSSRDACRAEESGVNGVEGGAPVGGPWPSADCKPVPTPEVDQTTYNTPGFGWGARIILTTIVIAALAAGAAAAKFYRDLTAANQALTSAATTLASLAGAAEQRATLNAVVNNVRRREYESVTRGLQELAGKIAVARPPALGGRGTESSPGLPGKAPWLGQPSAPGQLGGEEYVNVPPQAERFFRERPQLLGRVLKLVAGARELRDKGGDVRDLRKLRDEIVQAAARGDEAQVVRLMDKFEKSLMASGVRLPRAAGPGAGKMRNVPGHLREKVEDFMREMQRARREGKDARAAVLIARRAEQAAERGDMREAEELIDKARNALRRAPRMGRTRARVVPVGRDQLMVPGNPLHVLRLLFDMVRAEDLDLATGYKAVEHADLALREKNPDQIHEILSIGKKALERISKRRQEIARIVESSASGHPAGGRGTPARVVPYLTGPVAQRPAVEEIAKAPLAERLFDFLKRVRQMPEDEFEASKGRLAAALFSVLMPPLPQRGEAQTNEIAAERVRGKLRLAIGPLVQRKAAGEDTTPMEELFQHAREALYSGNTERAEELVDSALQMLGLIELPSEPSGCKPQMEQQETKTDEPPAPVASPQSNAAPGTNDHTGRF